MPFSRLKGNADSESTPRSHRKINVIDGVIGTINLDYRSLVRHFEKCDSVQTIANVMNNTLGKAF